MGDITFFDWSLGILLPNVAGSIPLVPPVVNKGTLGSCTKPCQTWSKL
jgi:hypothetical protein